MTTPTQKLTPTGQPEPEPTVTAVLNALEAAWDAIRTQHPEIPAAVIIVASGSPTKPNKPMKWGHFATGRWQAGTNQHPEVLVSGEGLNRPAAEVFTTLLHEAAHGMADARGIQDTSRQGRWHNKQFAKLAAELGMTTTKDDKLGFSPCQLSEITTVRYRATIDAIDKALTLYRHPEVFETKEKTTTNNGLSIECACPRKVRASIKVVDAGPIWCGLCGEAFLTEDNDREAFNATNPKPGHHNQDRDNAEDQEDENVQFYDPTGTRFGIPTYPFKGAPTGLATIRQLRAQGLRPGGQQPAAQMLWRKGKRVAYLYHIDKAAPKRTATPRQLAAIERALLARRTCGTCGQVKPYHIPRRYGECLDCAPEATR